MKSLECEEIDDQVSQLNKELTIQKQFVFQIV